MSYTNTTPNYGLPQYVADDKPTYLGDFNKAMLDIDTAMKNNENKATSSDTNAQNAVDTATQALTTANSASTVANSASSDVSSLQTIVNNMQVQVSNAVTDSSNANTNSQQALSNSNQALTNANVAKTTADLVQESVDNILTWSTPVNIINSSIAGATDELMCTFNTSLKLITLYGTFNFTPVAGNNVIGTLPEGITRPSSERVIYDACHTTTGQPLNLRVQPNGDIVYLVNSPSGSVNGRANLMINYNAWN